LHCDIISISCYPASPKIRNFDALLTGNTSVFPEISISKIKSMGLKKFFINLVVLGFELRASHLLGMPLHQLTANSFALLLQFCSWKTSVRTRSYTFSSRSLDPALGNSGSHRMGKPWNLQFLSRIVHQQVVICRIPTSSHQWP
jgi:hypothetical protein